MGYAEDMQAEREARAAAEDNRRKFFAKIISLSAMAFLGFVALGMWGCPKYNVWQQGLVGEAELKRAEQNRKIAVQEAEAKKESASLLAQAEVERAKGVAEANQIIGEGLRGHEEYLRYLWIMSLEHVAQSPNGSTVVYVPTEASLPVLEAGRFTSQKGTPQ